MFYHCIYTTPQVYPFGNLTCSYVSNYIQDHIYCSCLSIFLVFGQMLWSFSYNNFHGSFRLILKWPAKTVTRFIGNISSSIMYCRCYVTMLHAYNFVKHHWWAHYKQDYDTACWLKSHQLATASMIKSNTRQGGPYSIAHKIFVYVHCRRCLKFEYICQK